MKPTNYFNGSAHIQNASHYNLIIIITSGLNSDGFEVEITDDNGKDVFKKSYRYGYNASYSREDAIMAEETHEKSIKYNWVPSIHCGLKPFVGDIIDELCNEYNIDKKDILYRAGANVFTGNKVSDQEVQNFISEYVLI